MIDWMSFFNPVFLVKGSSMSLAYSLLLWPIPLGLLFGVVLILTAVVVRRWAKPAFWWKVSVWLGMVILLLSLMILPVINYLGLFELHAETAGYRDKHQEGLEYIFLDLIPWTNTCMKTVSQDICSASARQKIMSVLLGDESIRNFPSTYFVRLSDSGELEKLFLDGQFQTDLVNHYGEQKVVKFIRSNRQFFIGAFIDEAYFATYLGDLYAEAEVLVPVYKDGKTIGLMVRLYGS